MSEQTIPDDVIEFVEQLSNAATMCLADDLSDLASNMREGRQPEHTAPVARVIKERLRAKREQTVGPWHEAEAIARGAAPLNWWIATLLAEYDRRGGAESETMKLLRELVAWVDDEDAPDGNPLWARARIRAGHTDARRPMTPTYTAIVYYHVDTGTWLATADSATPGAGPAVISVTDMASFAELEYEMRAILAWLTDSEPHEFALTWVFGEQKEAQRA